MLQYRKIFPTLNNCIYADTAATGLMSDQQLDWRRHHDHDLINQASGLWPEKIKILADTREMILRFFHSSDGEVALVPNFSLGLNLLLENQDRKQHVLLIENDYPSVNWPFENRRFEINYVKPDQDMEAQIFKMLRTKNIDILALSLVQWLNGIKIDLAFLAEIKKIYPGLLIIADGTQYCGAFEFKFDRSGIDIMGASGYKWLLGGYGNGFMLFSKEISSRLQLSSIGFNSADGNMESKDQILFPKYLEPGHLDSLNFGSLKNSMEFLRDIGIKSIEEQNRRLLTRAKNVFGNLGLLEDEVLARKEHGAIFRLVAENKLFRHLVQKSVRCSWRADGIRLSFHFYNTEKEIDRIAEIIKNGL